VRRFLDDILPRDDAVVLRGRCYEHESVPHEALDSIVDALTRALLGMPVAFVEELCPRDIGALTRLFPVLKRVAALAVADGETVEPPDPQETRRRAFGALRCLLQRLAERRRLVISIDDLHWGDIDSAGFLSELFLRGDAPALLFVGTYRSDEADKSPLLLALRAAAAQAVSGAVLDIELQPLTADEAAELIDVVRPGRFDEQSADRLVRDSGGHPMFLAELARRATETRARTGEHLSLDALIATRVAALTEVELALLRACAVAGRPLPPRVIMHAADVRSGERALGRLRRDRLLRWRHGSDQACLEPYHNRIRSTVVEALDPDQLRAQHASLARALAAQGGANRAAQVEHWIGAGEHRRAGDCALPAAAEAEQKLAFARAAELYAVALAHSELDGDERRTTQAKHAHALTNAGRLDEAAAAFAQAADAASGDQALEYRRLQLEQLLRRGHLDRGMALAGEVLEAVGRRLPTSDRGAVFSILIARARMRLTGCSFRERQGQEVSPEARRRLDVLWSLSSAIAFASPTRGRALQMQFMRDALRIGDPRRVAQALCLELGYLGIGGAKRYARCEVLRERAIAIAHRIDDMQLVGTIESGGGLTSFLSGRWAEALQRFTDSERRLRDHAANARWEIDITQIFQLAALTYLGRFRELSRLLPAYLREAEERGDLYATRGLQGWRANLLWLARDQPAEASARVDEVSIGTTGTFHLHHFYELTTRGQIDLYLGQPADANDRVEHAARDVQRGTLLRIQTIRVEWWHLRGRIALALAAQTSGDEQRRLLALTARASRQIMREKVMWGAPLAGLLRAGAARLQGDASAALTELRTAADDFQAADMAAYASAARACAGLVLGGDDGAHTADAALERMQEAGIVNPAAMIGVLAPACHPG